MKAKLGDVEVELVQSTDGRINPKFYREMASWWPLLSPRDGYEEEAKFFRDAIFDLLGSKRLSVLELGCGGGHVASYLKAHFQLTLSDMSASMLEMSRALNPDCEHQLGDMRTIRLKRQFDAVLVHDAIVYMVTKSDLHQALETAYVHCRPGGVIFLVPDHVKDTFEPCTRCSQHHEGQRSLRFMESVCSSDGNESTCDVDHIYLFKDSKGPLRIVHQRLIWGLFDRAFWLDAIRKAGFRADILYEPHGREVFIGKKTTEETPVG